MAAKQRLSEKSETVLSLIASGHSYDQIVNGNPALTYLDVFRAADEALTLLGEPASHRARMAAIREEHPRAYEPWLPEEDDVLRAFFGNGLEVEVIASRLQRQRGAITSRLRRLGLGR